jgi:RNA-binding protein
VELSGRQRKWLRGRAHALEPVVHVGKAGLSEEVVAQVDRALEAHELIKVRFGEGREGREGLIAEIERRTGSKSVGRVGHVGIFFRPRADPGERRIVPPEA